MTNVRIFQKGAQGAVALEPQEFNDESELETVLADMPNLLAEPEGPPLALVARQVSLKETGRLDLLMVDGDGTPVVVEVKLGRNSESRREVVGQVIDYVSTLTTLTVDELDQAVSGAVEAALRLLPAEGDPDEVFERLWANVGANLRAGLARYVLAIDNPPPDLQRIVRFLAARSSLRVSLVSIQKYLDANGDVIFVPRQDVVPAQGNDAPLPAAKRQPSAELQAVLDAYAAVAPAGLPTIGRAANYRQIAPSEWPSRLHYEFMKRGKGIGVELHLESKAAQTVAETVQAFAGPARPTFPYHLDWDPAWTYGPRLFTTLPLSMPPNEIAAAMTKLITLTRDTVTKALVAGAKT